MKSPRHCRRESRPFARPRGCRSKKCRARDLSLSLVAKLEQARRRTPGPARCWRWQRRWASVRAVARRPCSAAETVAGREAPAGSDARPRRVEQRQKEEDGKKKKSKGGKKKKK